MDSQRFRQVLLNLLLNALHAQPQGGWITITFAEAELRVADGGPGVPEDLIATIFDPFVSEREGGTGLGLHFAQQVAQAHQASLSYDGAAFCWRQPTERP